MAYSDPTDTLRQERDAEAHDAEARERRRKELDDLRWLLANPQGRRIAGRVLSETGIYRSSFNTSGSVMAFQEGKRQVGLWLTAELLEAAPEGYFKILKQGQP